MNYYSNIDTVRITFASTFLCIFLSIRLVGRAFAKTVDFKVGIYIYMEFHNYAYFPPETWMELLLPYGQKMETYFMAIVPNQKWSDVWALFAHNQCLVTYLQAKTLT